MVKGKVSGLVFSVLAPKKARGCRTIADLIDARFATYVTDDQVSDSLTYLSRTGRAYNLRPMVGGKAAGENWVRA